MSLAATLIKRSRSAGGLTQAELARLAGVTQPVIARLEREGANPRLATLEKVIAASGHSLKLELGGDFGIDETMIAADLKLTADERLRRFEAFYGSAQALGGAARRGT